MSKNVVQFELTRGGGAAGGAADELHCEVEASFGFAVAWLPQGDVALHANQSRRLQPLP